MRLRPAQAFTVGAGAGPIESADRLPSTGNVQHRLESSRQRVTGVDDATSASVPPPLLLPSAARERTWGRIVADVDSAVLLVFVPFLRGCRCRYRGHRRRISVGPVDTHRLVVDDLEAHEERERRRRRYRRGRRRRSSHHRGVGDGRQGAATALQ
ncbi:unnamed protein product [Ectocarpus sp. 13 AM-2016]